MSVRSVMFDLGGVLVRVEPERLLEVLPKGEAAHAQVARLMDDPAWAVPFELGHVTPRQFFEQLAQHLSVTCSFERFVEVWNGMLSENADTIKLIERLRERYTLLVLTNTNVFHDEYIRRTWPRVGRVHHWVASYQVGIRKPDPQMFQLAVRRTGVSPDATVYIDDRADHVAAARQLGLTAIQFTPGMKLEEELRAVGVHV